MCALTAASRDIIRDTKAVSFLPREHRLMSAARRSDAQCAFQRLPTRNRAAMTHVRRDGTSVSCHKQSSHNATFGDTARLAIDNGGTNRRDDNRSRDSRTRDAALWHADRLAIDHSVGRPGTHGDSDKQRDPVHDKLTTRNMTIPPPQVGSCRKACSVKEPFD